MPPRALAVLKYFTRNDNTCNYDKLLWTATISAAALEPTICICENKGADQLRGNREADQRLRFRYPESTIPLLLKSEISSFCLLWLYSPVCVGPDRNPNCWFSHEQAHLKIAL